MSAELPPSSERPARRIVIDTESSIDQINGVSGSVRRVAAHLALRQCDALILAPQPLSKTLFTEKKVEGFPVKTNFAVPINGFWVGVPSHQVTLNKIKDFNPDAIHLASPCSKQGNAGLKSAKVLHKPTVSVYQTDAAQYARRFTTDKIPKKLHWLRERSGDNIEQFIAERIASLHNKSTLNLVPSSSAWKYLEGIGVNPDTMRMWGRGVDTDLYRPEWAQTEEVVRLKQEWSQQGTRTVVGYVGRLAPEKTVERLAVLAVDPSIRLVIVGDGPSKAKLQTLLPKDTLFLGEQTGETLAQSYAAFDLFVHPGNDETFGQAIQEGMASGVPVIVPDKGGPLDTVDEGFTGLFYDHQSDESLRERVLYLADRPDLRRQMGATAARTMKGRSWEAVGDQLLDYYEEAIKRFTA